MAFTVTPWEVSGDIDYNKLIKEFGTEPLSEKTLKRIEKVAGELHPYLKRKIFFCHRDLNWLLDEYDKGNKFFLYTGRGPSEKVHLGHLTVWRFTKWLQDKFGVELYFQLTDDEKFLFKNDLTLEDTNKLAYENALDIVALGFDPKKTFIFANTDYGKTMYKQALRVAKKLTFSTVKAAFGFKDENNVGQIFFTSMQSVPCFLPSVQKGKNIPCLIPLAVDQDPHFRITRDIMPKLGYYKPAIIHQRFLPALEGTGKMSSSNGITIYTTDTPKEVKNKINKYAFSGGKDTVEEHRKTGGNPDIDTSYQWLTFFEDDDSKLKNIHDDYKSGKLLSGELKAILIEKLNFFLAEHQKKREYARKTLDKFIIKD
ncbi:MAG: tryptophan--tRNA ligase [Nanoarchaeota archaeon]|nr:tryptophan--tRNA ligase [Nanoarchaeota archaeon]MBU1703779.1 tryptophan--tRNA ligase [Nanoarchaeota archaeon]